MSSCNLFDSRKSVYDTGRELGVKIPLFSKKYEKYIADINMNKKKSI
jgi:hypothetical protein